jgi:hypothetical protein
LMHCIVNDEVIYCDCGMIVNSLLYFNHIILFSRVCSPQTLVRALRYVADRQLHFPLNSFYFYSFHCIFI